MNLVRIARRVSDKSKTKSAPKKTKKTKKKPDRVAEPVRQPELEIPDISMDVLDPGVEYSFKVDLSLVVDFEGDASEVSEPRLRKKLKSEVLAAIKGAVLMTANDFGLRANNIKVNPVSVSSAMNDQTSIDERGVGNV